MNELEYFFDEIETCECIGMFDEEYVYDIEMEDETHTFIANDILVHNSLYISYDDLLSTIKGSEDFDRKRKLDIIVNINKKFLNDHNEKYMTDYYASRFVKSIHEFELETVALSGLWLNVKKRYCQILLWKDGKYFDDDSLPMKVKGLEMVKSSYPKFVRENLKKVVRSILESPEKNMDNLWAQTNALVQQQKMAHKDAELEDICASQGVNGYTKYIIDKETFEKLSAEYDRAMTNKKWDKSVKIPAAPNATVIDESGTILYTAPKCPANVRALGNYNAIREAHNLKGDPIYGGKCKIYLYRPPRTKESAPFAFQSKNYPKWGDEYAPVDRNEMFKKYFLDPLNRICNDSMQFAPFTIDGYKRVDLFGMPY